MYGETGECNKISVLFSNKIFNKYQILIKYPICVFKPYIHDYKQYLWNIFLEYFLKIVSASFSHNIIYQALCFIFKTIQKVVSTIIPILKIRKLRLTEVK